MGKKNDTPRSFFIVQYQIGKVILSEKAIPNPDGYIPIREMFITILKLVIQVRDKINKDVAGKVALKALRAIHKLCYNVQNDWYSTGGSQSKYLNLENAKSKEDQDERFDIEFQGFGGRDDFSNEVITRYIGLYKEIIRDRNIK